MDAGAIHFVPSGEGGMVMFQAQRGCQSAHDEPDEGTGFWVAVIVTSSLKFPSL